MVGPNTGTGTTTNYEWFDGPCTISTDPLGTKVVVALLCQLTPGLLLQQPRDQLTQPCVALERLY